MQTYAYYNHGRWLVDCPKCGQASAFKRGTPTWMCISCHSALVRDAFVAVKSVDIQGNEQSILRPVADIEIRARTQAEVRAAGEEWEIVWPAFAEQIENILRPVDDLRWCNWYPDRPELRARHGSVSAWGQTLDELRAEVKAGH